MVSGVKVPLAHCGFSLEALHDPGYGYALIGREPHTPGPEKLYPRHLTASGGLCRVLPFRN